MVSSSPHYPVSRDVSRRTFLQAATGVSLGAVAGRAGASEAPRSFDPTVHGFDFSNWAPGDGRYPEHEHDDVTPTGVEQLIKKRWKTPFSEALGVQVDALPESLLAAIAKQLYVSAVQASAANGHCWGIGYTAQRYFEHPEEVPAGRETASEFDHPMAPLSQPNSNPVSTDIDDYQLFQVLDADAWIGRRGILNPGWIRLDKQVRNVTSAIEEFGTANITLVNPADRSSHIVLAYAVRDAGETTELDIYDPNIRASGYSNGRTRTLTVRAGSDGPTMDPYGDYRTFLYNDRQRIVMARGEASAAPAFSLGSAGLRDELLSVAVFLLQSEGARMTVVDPKGEPVRRDWAPFASRDRSRYDQMRYRYNPEAGRYHVVVTGRSDTEFTFSVHAADRDGELVREEHTGQLAAGETATFAVDIPETGTETGSFEPVESLPDWLLTGGGVAVGAIGAKAVNHIR